MHNPSWAVVSVRADKPSDAAASATTKLFIKG